MFARYAVPVRNGPWHAPDVRRGQAHLYRTVIRNAGAQAPDFAGHYRIAWIGCGAATVCPAFLDRTSGRVHFPPEVASVSADLVYFVGETADGFDRIIYRTNSRLFVALGARNEDARTSGATLYEWRHGKLRLIRFIPLQALCMKKEGA